MVFGHCDHIKWLANFTVIFFIVNPAYSEQRLAKRDEVLIVRDSVSKSSADTTSAARSFSSKIERISLPRSSAVFGVASDTTSDVSELEEYCRALKRSGEARLCSPNYRYTATLVPNDTNYSSLYGMTNIDAPSAWNITTGSRDVVVAVIDTGVQYSHPDLSANVWTNSNEVVDGIDNDNNGYVDDLHGYDFSDGDNDPNDENGHGTHVSGTIGAVGDNSLGVVGVNHSVSIQPIRVLDASGSGYTSDIVLGLNYAAANGASVINMSLGGGGYSEVFENAIYEAGQQGVIVVVAAGNESTNNDSTPSYPANYNLSNMLTVAATDENDALAYFSNYGATTVQIAAPGVDILSTYPTDEYEYLDGTSMASPHVAGAAALIKAANPTLTPFSIRSLILDNGDVISGLSGKVSSGMRLNVSNAVAASIGATPIPDPSSTVKKVSVSTLRVGSRKYRITTAVRNEQNRGVSGISLKLSCSESNGHKKTYRKSGASDSHGSYVQRITFSSGTTRAVCRSVATNLGKSSSKVSFKVKR